MKRWEIIEFILGSAKSGHWGHAGRPGKRGGSVARSVAMSLKTGKDWKKRQAAKGSKFGSSKVTSSKPLGAGEKGVNTSVVLEFEDGSRGIFKAEPMSHGTANGEILAYELSQSLGWDIVPETLEYTYQGQTGSLQKWVDNAETAMIYGLRPDAKIEFDPYGKAERINDPILQRDYDRMKALDALLYNHDRHDQNWLVTADGRIVAIDNGGSFGVGWGGMKMASATHYSPSYPKDNAMRQVVRAWKRSAKFDDFALSVSDRLGKEYAEKLENYL